MYVLSRVGPALKSLREARGLRQADVAKRAGVSDSIPSRAESPEAKLNLQTLFRYLDAVGATLTDLDRELRQLSPLDAEITRHEQRLEDDPSYRQALRRFYSELGFDPDAQGELTNIAEVLERYREHDQRLEGIETRLEELEKDGNGS